VDYYNIVISEELARNLVLRDNASELFNRIESLKQKHISIDFKGVQSMSRSFAHEYITRKNNSSKCINEINMPIELEKTFDVVSNEPRKKKRFPQLENARILTL